MKVYKFFESNGYQLHKCNFFKCLPAEFTYDELVKCNNKAPTGMDYYLNLAEYKLKRIRNAKKDTTIHVRHYARDWDIVIMCLGEDMDSEICQLREELEKNKNRRDEIYEELYRTSKELIDEQKLLEKKTVKLKAYIKSFDEGALFKKNKKGWIKITK